MTEDEQLEEDEKLYDEAAQAGRALANKLKGQIEEEASKHEYYDVFYDAFYDSIG